MSNHFSSQNPLSPIARPDGGSGLLWACLPCYGCICGELERAGWTGRQESYGQLPVGFLASPAPRINNS